MAPKPSEPCSHMTGCLPAGAFEALPDIALVVDRNGIVLSANRAACAFAGATAEEIVGRHCHDRFHAAASSPDPCPICAKIAAGAAATAAEIEWRPGFWHQIVLSPFSTGGFEGLVQVNRDVTAQKEAKQALRRTAHSYRTLVDNLPQCVFLKDTESRLISCNRSFADFTGFDAERIQGKSVYEIHPPELAERFRQEDLRVLASGVMEEFEGNYEANGKQFTAHVMKTPVRDVDGEVTGILGICWDITDSKHAEEKLRESQLRYEAILQSASDAILIADDAWRIIDANQRAEQLFGFTKEEFLQLTARDLDAADNDMPLDQVFAVLDERGSSIFEHKMQRKNGSVVYAEASAARIAWGGKHVYLGSFRDISQRKQIEAEVSNYRNHLEELVEERTHELTAMNRELEAFSYSVSHDLRSPLRAINGFAEALREELAGQQLSDDVQYFLSRMSIAAVRMGDLIDGLLNLAKVSRSELRFGDVNLSAVASSHIAILRESEPGRNIKCHVEAGMATVGDPTLLQVLIGNVLNNAWKFTAKRQDAVIEFGRELTDVGEVFHVRDNGAGFDMQFAPKLFQPFVRLHDPGEFHGTGIGLATVRRIVERHGGRVWAEGRPGHGATVYFVLAPRKGRDVPDGGRARGEKA